MDFGNQYNHVTEETDPRFPKPLMKELEINVFSDSDYGHDRMSGRWITGVLGFVQSTSVMWRSSRQLSVQTSTFGAKFQALPTAVQDTVTVQYYLSSMGVKVSKQSNILVDNQSIFLNSTIPGSPLNKKHVALSYHYVREHVANKVVRVLKIDSHDNYVDPLTKGMNSTEHRGFTHNILHN